MSFLTLNLILLVIALIGGQCHGSPVDPSFEYNVQKLFDNAQAAADQLVVEGKHEDGQALRKISVVATEILIHRHAIIQEVARLTEDALKREYGFMYDSSDPMISNLILMTKERAKLRAMVDAYKLTTSKWKMMHLLIKHYVMPKDDQSPLKVMGYKIYSLLREKGVEATETFELMEDLADDIVSAGINDKSIKADVYDDADYLIEEAVGCTKCRSKRIDRANYELRPIHTDPEIVSEWMKLEVDGELLEKLNKALEQTKGHVIEPDEKAINEVSEDDIDDLAEDFLLEFE